VTYSFRPYHDPGVDSGPSEDEYQEYFLGGKCGRCVGLTTLPPSCADCLEIWEPQTPGTLWATPALFRDCFTFLSVTVQQPTTCCSKILKSHSSVVIQKPTKDITYGLKTAVKVATLVVRFHPISRIRMRGYTTPRPHVLETPQLNSTVCSQLGQPLPAARSPV